MTLISSSKKMFIFTIRIWLSELQLVCEKCRLFN